MTTLNTLLLSYIERNTSAVVTECYTEKFESLGLGVSLLVSL